MARQRVNRGSIVLIRYPFTDRSSLKVRPAVIVMSDRILVKTDDAFVSLFTQRQH